MKINRIIIAILYCALVTLTLTGCDSTSKTSSTKAHNKMTEQKKVYTKKINDELNECLKKRNILYLNDKLNKSGEIAGIKYKYKSIEVSKITPNTENKDLYNMDTNGNDGATVVVIRFDVENTTYKKVNFYAGGTELTTNTKEQIKPGDWQPSEYDGKLLAKAKRSGEIMYVLKNTKAEDLKRVKLKVPVLRTTDGDKLGQPLTLDFQIK